MALEVVLGKKVAAALACACTSMRACSYCLSSVRSRSTPPPRAWPPATLQINAVDTNGAGDTFATVYMIATLLGDPDPGSTASW